MKQQCDTSRLAGSNDTTTPVLRSCRSEGGTALPARECSQGTGSTQSTLASPRLGVKNHSRARFSSPEQSSNPLPLTPGLNPVVEAATPPVKTVSTVSRKRQPKFRLRKDQGFWLLTRGDESAIIKHELGLDYVAYLMAHPDEPIHGLALGLKIRAVRNGEPMDSAEVIQERALALDDVEASRALYRKQRELEGIIDDELTVEAVRDEAYAQLKEILEFQKKSISRTSSQARRASHAVGTAINRLYARLAKAQDEFGQPHILLREFARTIRQHILNPSGRGQNGGARSQAEGGYFTYATRPNEVSAS